MKKFAFYLFVISFVGFSQTSYDFLRLDFSARSAALGGSFLTAVEDPNIIFYNPAGVAFNNTNTISFGYVKHLIDVNAGSMSFNPIINPIGRIGFGIQYINYGSFDKKDEYGNKLGTFGSNQLALYVNYSRKIKNLFSYGGNIKFVYSNIGEYSSAAIALDLGASYYEKENNFGVGFSLLNIGTQIKKYGNVKEELPFEIRFGISKKLEHLPARFSLDFTRLNFYDDNFFTRFKYFAVGTEIYLSDKVSLRFGYNNERRTDLKLNSSSSQGLTGFNGGIGIAFLNYKLDYGLSFLGEIGSLHRINFYLSY